MRKQCIAALIVVCTVSLATQKAPGGFRQELQEGSEVPTADDFDIFHLAELFDLTPDGAEVYFYRGNAYYKTGDYGRAYADWDQVLRLNPDGD